MVFSAGSDGWVRVRVRVRVRRRRKGIGIGIGIGLFNDCGGNSILQREDLKELPVCLFFECYINEFIYYLTYVYWQSIG